VAFSAGADAGYAGFLEEVRERLSLLDGAPAGYGPPAMALREKQAVVVNDVEADPRIRHKNRHVDRGIRSLVNMTAASEGLALVSTIINLAHSLKLKVVAEGVETEEQSRLLRLLSCDEMQGFLSSKPVPGEIFETRYLVPPPVG